MHEKILQQLETARKNLQRDLLQHNPLPNRKWEGSWSPSTVAVVAAFSVSVAGVVALSVLFCAASARVAAKSKAVVDRKGVILVSRLMRSLDCLTDFLVGAAHLTVHW